jgi:3-phosphoshikimate 1-carboxyvinyltransferase
MTDSWWTSTDRVTVPAGRVARGRVRIPGSKSLTNRALAMALLTHEPVTLVDPLESEDTVLFRRALEKLGYGVEVGPDGWRLAATAAPPSRSEIDCGNAGTVLRFLVALLATVPGRWTLDGTPRLRERPVGRLCEALSALGVRIEFPSGRPGFAPLVVHGGKLSGGRVRLDAGESSQYLSALLLAGQRAASPLEIEVPRLTSSPYVEMTVNVLAKFGGRVERPRGDVWVSVPTVLSGGAIEIEPDLSSACYPAAAAALTGGEVVLERVHLDSRQGDRRLIELLGTMGAEVEDDVEGVRVRGRELRAVEVDLADAPDQVPTLAALAPFARGTTRITNVAHLRLKESDRLASMARELARAGATVEELPDGLTIPGIWSDTAPPSTPVEIDPHADHRIAMSLALVGLRRLNLAIRDPGVVAKSWPGFWEELAAWTGTGSAGAEEGRWE